MPIEDGIRTPLRLQQVKMPTKLHGSPLASLSRLVFALVLTVIPLTAHGGSYSGPRNPGGNSGSPGGVGGRTGGRALGGVTPVPNAGASDVAKWESWWALNKEEFLPATGAATSGTPLPGYAASTPRPLTPEEVRTHVIPVLQKALTDKETNLRDSAAIALGKCGDVRDVAALLTALGDKDRTVVEGAIIGLGLLGDPRAEKKLVEIFQDRSEHMRSRGIAAIALGYSGGDLAQKALFDGLGSELSGGDGSKLNASQIESARLVGAALWAGADQPGGSDDRSALVAALMQRALDLGVVKDRRFLGIGVAALSKPRDHGSLKHVLAALGDSRSDVRAGGAIAAGRVIRTDDKKSIQALIAALGSEGDFFAKRMMLMALGRIGGIEAQKQLLLELDDKDRQHRSFAALALAVSGATAVAPRLRAELEKGNDESLRGAMVISLGILRDGDAAKTVGALVEKESGPELLSHCMWFYALTRDRSAVPAIEKTLLHARTPELQAAAAVTLGLLGSVDSIPTLVKLLNDSGTINVKGAVATALGRMGDRRAFDALRKIIENPSEQPLARAFAVVGLGILAQRNPWPPFSRIAIDGHYGLTNEAVDELRDLL